MGVLPTCNIRGPPRRPRFRSSPRPVVSKRKMNALAERTRGPSAPRTGEGHNRQPSYSGSTSATAVRASIIMGSGTSGAAASTGLGWAERPAGWAPSEACAACSSPMDVAPTLSPSTLITLHQGDPSRGSPHLRAWSRRAEELAADLSKLAKVAGQGNSTPARRTTNRHWMSP